MSNLFNISHMDSDVLYVFFHLEVDSFRHTLNHNIHISILIYHNFHSGRLFFVYTAHRNSPENRLYPLIYAIQNHMVTLRKWKFIRFA